MVKWQGSAGCLLSRIAWKLMTGAAIIALTAGCTRLGKKDPPRQKLAAFDYSKQARPPLKSNNPLHIATAHWAKQHMKNPADPRSALNYANNLKALGSKEKAYSVLAVSYQLNRGNNELASDYGRLALDLGKPRIAEPLLNQAMRSKGKSDWRVLSALGTLNAKRGDQKKAQSYYLAALRKKPDAESVFNNLALSYALDGKAGDAENVLRRAVSKGQNTERIRQNLALVLGLQNKNAEARMIAQADIPGEAKTKTTIIPRSFGKPAIIAKNSKKLRKLKVKAGTVTTASLPARKPVITNAITAHRAKQTPPAAPVKMVKLATARKSVNSKPALKETGKASAEILPWHGKQKNSVKLSKIRTASLAARTRQPATRAAPKAELNWNITVEKSRTVETGEVKSSQIKSHILKNERAFSFPTGN